MLQAVVASSATRVEGTVNNGTEYRVTLVQDLKCRETWDETGGDGERSRSVMQNQGRFVL
jgi:hypothetical protein